MSSLEYVEQISMNAKQASRLMAKATPEAKNLFFREAAKLLQANKAAIMAANEKDIAKALAEGMDEWKIDRLRLTDKTIASLRDACRQVEGFPDPVGVVETQWQRPNGLLVGKMRMPIGVLAMIYEARPAVTVDASILALKAGNAVILRGGKESANSNQVFMDILHEALKASGLPVLAAQLLAGGHDVVMDLCRQDKYIDVIIPRGGEKLIRAVCEAARMPVLMHYKGVCHAYIDKGANLEQAVKIVENSKTQRPAVCNALECLLVHRDEAARFLPMLAQALAPCKVQFRADEGALPLLLPNAVPLKPEDLGCEFSAQILAVLIVADMDAAINHIAEYGSHHTDIICTNDYARSMRFLREVDSSMVAVNASTRFNDGGELGLGAEIGISTSKLHAYGPMGVREMTCAKFVVLGMGQIRE